MAREGAPARHQDTLAGWDRYGLHAVEAEARKLDAECSLLEFIKLLWPVLEPGREFVHGWAVEAICEHLEAVTRGEIRRLLINVPPGCMKSLTTNVFWPAWEWGPQNRPHLRYIGASYSADLTIRDNRRARMLVQSPQYVENWGERVQLLSDQNAKVRFDTSATGWKIATSVGGLGTGERGDRFIIDDPHNVKDSESEQKRSATLQWFTEVVPTRVNDAMRSAIVVIMQRVHDQDVSGLILRNELGYDHLCLPMEYEKKNRCMTPLKREGQKSERVARLQREHDALPRWCTDQDLADEAVSSPLPPTYAPKWVELYPQDRRDEEGELLWAERFPEAYLENDLKPSLRAWGGTYAEAGQLQQRPAPRSGGLFGRDAWNFCDVGAVPPGGRWVRGWDLAGSKKKTSKYTVGCKMGIVQGRVYITDIRRFQGSPMEVENAIRSCAELDGHGTAISIPQDPGQAGLAQKAALAQKLHGWRVNFTPESGSKEDRAKPLAAQQEAGNVCLQRAGWTSAFIGELASFPTGLYSDQADAASRAYAYLVRKRTQGVGAAPTAVEGS